MNWVFVDLDDTIASVDWTDVVFDNNEPVPNEIVEKKHEHADVIQPMMMLLYNLRSPVVFITNRRLTFRESTLNWLKTYKLLSAVIMRPEDETLEHGDFKAKWIKTLLEPGDTAIVIDDDPNGSVERVCTENGWVHLKVTTYPNKRKQLQ